MDMSNVKALFDNNMQKNVKKITDANGNIIWYKIPDGYRKVEYLESSGTQYIDTGWINNQRAIHSYKMKFQSLALTVGGFFGPYNSSVRPGTLWMTNNNFKMSIGSDNSVDSKVSYAYDTNIHTFTNEINEDEGTYRITFNSEESYKTYSGTVYSEGSTCLFRSSTTNYVSVSARIFYFIICKNGQEVRHLIPVVRNSDDKPGMYDLVNDVFYTNAGTGEFTYGGVIDNNLFLGFDSPWCCNFGCNISNGFMGTKATEDFPNRTTYFFACKPNTTYRYTAETPGDRFCIFTLKTLYDDPPAYISSAFPYRETADNVSIIENSNTSQINTTTDYTFTTGLDDKMVYIYFALNTRPTGVRIVEVES